MPPKNLSKTLQILQKYYPNAKSVLHYKTPLQALISALLAPQTTDRKVNELTPGLFKKYPTARAYAQASLKALEKDISSVNFFRNKAKSIQKCAQALVQFHGGKVPREHETLVKLPGIGRKTAHMILANAYGIPGMIVDTHVLRVSKRLGLTHKVKPDEVEEDLAKIIPKQKQALFSYQLVDHGRALCMARKPLCDKCPLEIVCPKVGL